MAKQRSANRTAPDDVAADAKAFRAAVSDVTPMAQTALAAGLARAKPRARLRRNSLPSAENLNETMPLVAGADDVTGDAALTFQRSGVRIQVMRRLRRGLIPVEGDLDLHGLSQTAARDRLADFIARSRDGGCRCVRVVHGKGYRSGVRGPVLKSAVNLWLRRHTDVMAFVSARTIDGGSGAVYVLLRS